MNYYEVLVGDPYYHGSTALTYCSNSKIPIRSVVAIAIRGRNRLGIVVKKVTKPAFKASVIDSHLGLILPAQSLELLEWLRLYYPGPLGATTQLFLPSSLSKKGLDKLPGQEHADKFTLPKQPELTAEQQAVLDKIRSSDKTSFLLHGETGSGKTRVYTELAAESIKSGRSVLVLTPEIGLSSQLENEFKALFGSKTLLFHSNLAPSLRRKAWLAALDSKSSHILVGPRSALFLPLNKIGLIIIDEAHETAYKQENVPYYYAPRVASKLASLHNAKIIFGTATPNIGEYFVAESKNVPILRMQEQAVKIHQQSATIKTIQIRDRSQFSKDAYLSDTLIKHLEQALGRSEQSLVFLNRRGSARVVLCQACGWQAVCPICDLPLTYHSDKHLLMCHTCGFSQKTPASCPECGSVDIFFKGIGTKALEDKLNQLFPKARIMRFDADNLKTERLENNLLKIRGGGADIIVGTQLLAKGLDIPKLSVVGVVSADQSLYLPDFTAEERTYQLLSQVIGRVGRGHRAGTAIIQTYNPDGPAIRAATAGNWQDFYKKQLQERQQFVFPPFCHLLKLTCARKGRAGAEKAAAELKEKLTELNLPVIIIGPAPAFHERSGPNFHWQLVIKSKNRQHLLDIIKVLPANWAHNIDPINLL